MKNITFFWFLLMTFVSTLPNLITAQSIVSWTSGQGSGTTGVSTYTGTAIVAGQTVTVTVTATTNTSTGFTYAGTVNNNIIFSDDIYTSVYGAGTGEANIATNLGVGANQWFYTRKSPTNSPPNILTFKFTTPIPIKISELGVADLDASTGFNETCVISGATFGMPTYNSGTVTPAPTVTNSSVTFSNITSAGASTNFTEWYKFPGTSTINNNGTFTFTFKGAAPNPTATYNGQGNILNAWTLKLEPVSTLEAVSDSYAINSGATSIGSVLANDTDGNGTSPAVIGTTAGTVSLSQISTTNSGVTLNSNGTISVAAGTLPGTYTLTYQICEQTALTNCKSATATVTVTNQTDAVNDAFGNVTPGSTTPTVFNNDKAADGSTPTSANTDVSLTNLGGLTGATINADGTINIPSGSIPGNYTLTYRICSPKGQTTNCDTATVTVTVPTSIDAVNGTQSVNAGVTGTTSVLSNDTLNGSPATLSTVNLTQASTTNAGVTLNTTTGMIQVAAGTPAGTYTVTYQICDKANPTVCDTATETVTVPTSIDAVNGTQSVNAGATGTTSVLSNDTLNGSPATLSTVNLTQTSTTNAGVTLNTTTGMIQVAAGTPAGTYTVTYQICDKANPTVCDTATETVTVPTSIDAVNGTQSVNAGATGTTSVLSNDTLNGSPATLSTVNLTQTSTTNAGVTLNTTTGMIQVAAGTPAGTYTVTYQICDKANPTVCDTATETVTVSVTSCSISGTTTVCKGAATQLTGSGTAATTNPWTSSDTTVASVNNSGLVTGLKGGTATITYTNNVGCVTSVTVTVTELGTSTQSITTSAETCTGNGSATVNITNAPVGAVYSFKLFKYPNLTTTVFSGVETATSTTLSKVFSGLGAGTYKLETTESLGSCSVSKSVDFTIANNIVQLAYTLTGTQSCTGTDLKVNVTAGNLAPNAYELRNADGSVVIKPFQSSDTFLNLANGTYLVAVKDACGNVKTQSYTVSNTLPSITFGYDNISPASCTEYLFSVILSGNIKAPISIKYTYVFPDDGQTYIINQSTSGQVSANIKIPSTQSYNLEVSITDTCGNVYTKNYTIQPKNVQVHLIPSGSSCGGKYLYILNTGNTFPMTLTFTSAPAGFQASNYNSNFNSSNTAVFTNAAYGVPIGSETQPVPDGEYTVKMVDACGIEITRNINITSGELTFYNVKNPGCEVGYGQAGIFLTGIGGVSKVGDITAAKLTTAPATFTGTLPYDVSNQISNGFLNLKNLPEGDYTLEAQTVCSATPITKIITIDGYHETKNVLNLVKRCSSFDFTLNFASNGRSKEFFLQKYNETTGLWTNPNTGVAQNSGQAVSEMNAYKFGSQFTPIGGYSESNFAINNIAAGTGKYRIVVTFTTGCEKTLHEFDTTPELSINDYYVFQCSNGKVNIGIDATGVEPLEYEIIEKDGNTSFYIDNGNSPLFTNLDAGSYVVRVTDACANIKLIRFSASDSKLPKITPNNLCHGENGSLSVPNISFMDVTWTKSPSATPIATGNILNFTPFNSTTDLGTYYATLSYNIPLPAGITCSDIVLKFDVTATNQTNPMAGTGQTVNISTTSITGPINLFDYVTGPYDDYGTWKETTSPLSNLLYGNIWNAQYASTGTYTFLYTVNGTCSGTASTEVKITLTSPLPVKAFDDNYTYIVGSPTLTTESVLASDNLGDGTQATTSNVNLTWATTNNTYPGITPNADGTFTINSAAQPGTYTYTYTICDKLAPSNCATAKAVIVVAEVTGCTYGNFVKSGTWTADNTTKIATATQNGVTITIDGKGNTSLGDNLLYTNFVYDKEGSLPLGNGYFNATSETVNTGATSGSGYPFYTPNLSFEKALKINPEWNTAKDDANNNYKMSFTVKLSHKVNKILLNVDRLGNFDKYLLASGGGVYTLLTTGITMTRLSGNPQFNVEGNSFYRTMGVPNGTGLETDGTKIGSAAGTIELYSAIPFDTLTFQLKGNGIPGIYADAVELLFEICPNVCYKPATVLTGGDETNHGITAMGRAGKDNGNWPMIRKGAYTALESQTKGFVVNRMSTTDIEKIKTDGKAVQGMMVYDTTANCLKIYDGTNWNCYGTQTCDQ